MNCSCVKRGMHASHLGRCFCWDGLGWLRCFFTVRFCKLFFFVLFFFSFLVSVSVSVNHIGKVDFADLQFDKF